MKHVVGWLLGVVLGVLGSAAAQEQVTLRFTTWAGGDALTLLQNLAAEYGKQHPGVKVDVETAPFGGYDQKIAVSIAGGNAPDVGWVAERALPGYLENKALLNLRPYVNADSQLILSDYAPTSLVLWSRGDGLYGLPFSFSPIFLYYNKDLFAKAGLPTPQEYLAQNQWNYETFLKAAEAIKKADPGVYGASLFRPDPQLWAGAILSTIYAYGGDVFNKNLTACALDSQGSVQAWQLAQGMVEGGVAPRPGEQATFASGRLGMYADQVSYSAQLRQVNFKWDIAPMPSGPAGRTTLLGQAGYVVFAASKHPKEAVAFLEYLSSIAAMKRTAQFFPPPRGILLNSSTFLNSNPLLNPKSLELAVNRQVAGARTFFVPANFAQINDVVVRYLDRLLRPGANVKEELGRVCQEVNGLLKK